MLASCSPHPPTGPSTDATLLSKIEGTWYYETDQRARKMINNRDHSFIDTTFVRDESNGKFQLRYARKGTYDVQHGVLIQKTTEWDIFWPTIGSVTPINYEIAFLQDDEMLLHPVDIFETTGEHPNELWNEWSTIKWVYHKTGENTAYMGRQEEYYIFHPDSSTASFGWHYLAPHPHADPAFKTDFTYTPPLLTMPGPGHYNIEVDFKFGKMFLYYNYIKPLMKKID